MGDIDLETLRELLRGVTRVISDGNIQRNLDEACERLGLPTPLEGDSKHNQVLNSLKALPDAQLSEVASRVLKQLSIEANTRNAIQDVLWAGENGPPIPKRTRREIARSLDLEDLIHSADRFLALLESLWVLDDLFTFGEFLGAGGANLRARIQQHVFRNPGDWSTEELLENLGAFEASDRRFVLFLEGLTSADVVLDEPAQRRIVTAMNPHLRASGLELRDIDTDGGYPVFAIVSTRTKHNRRPKNLIFASRTKPDIRLPNAIDNDIEILGDADAVLVYDLPIGPEGIRWRDLQAWWKDTHQLHDDKEAKKSLYNRLQSSLPERKVSPPQRHLWELYHEIHGPAVPDLPALLPEVWLHWDPKTVKMRGQDALLRFRMDFLLLMPHGQRVVLEVDGQHHYATDSKPDPAAYAANMCADRDLKLSGYEVFRFGASELQDKQHAREMVQRFFRDLFTLFRVSAL
ncbi:hypothetical protein [Nonomuraea sp. bgisy101]|uniref:AbiJ-related protein n=1 Tax=Nonomuraea sp. bgisy101 TaxID=3413784 RepID=UPI003D726896